MTHDSDYCEQYRKQRATRQAIKEAREFALLALPFIGFTATILIVAYMAMI